MQVRCPEPDSSAAEMADHVIVAGYGLAGEMAAAALREMGIPLVVLDLGPEHVRRASEAGHGAYFGDVTSEEVLAHLSLKKARRLVVAINDTEASVRAIRAARHLAPGVPILARSTFASDSERLLAAGADQVVAAEEAAAHELESRVLAGCASGNGADPD